MKASILIFFFSFAIYCTTAAQDLPHLKSIKLNKNAHFKGTEPLVLKVVAYLFETPIDKKNKQRTEAGQFLIKWMNGTPDYTFYLEEKETDFFNTDADFTLMYMAGLTKYKLQNPNISDKNTLSIGAMQLTLPYLYQQGNKSRWSTKLWELNDANQKGKLKEFLYN